MEPRARRGVALAALYAVALVTAAWWALALYPAANAPEWVSRTRLACFGAAPGGLPNAGGWLLLIFQPVGMLAVLLAVWRDALWADLRWLAARRGGRFVLGATLGVVTVAVLSAASTIRRVNAGGEFSTFSGLQPTLIDVPGLVLTDQSGKTFDLGKASATTLKPILVTFAFAHCETMCPTQIHELLQIRTETGRSDIPLVVVTVDPWRDVPSRLPSMAAAWALAPGDHILSGSVDSVNAVLDTWGIARQRDSTTGDVLHALVAVLVDAGGLTATRIDADMSQLRSLLGAPERSAGSGSGR